MHVDYRLCFNLHIKIQIYAYGKLFHYNKRFKDIGWLFAFLAAAAVAVVILTAVLVVRSIAGSGSLQDQTTE